MKNLLFVLCVVALCSCTNPKPIDTYTSNLVWFAKFQHTHGGSDPMKPVANPKGLFIIKRFIKTIEIDKVDTQFNLTIDSFKSYDNSTRYFLTNERHKLFQLSIYADSEQRQKSEAHIEFMSWSKPYYSRFMDWNPTYVYAMIAVRQ